ncbi:ribonuclease H-like domain-containing protein, partial [Tanacetum coccineum]
MMKMISTQITNDPTHQRNQISTIFISLPTKQRKSNHFHFFILNSLYQTCPKFNTAYLNNHVARPNYGSQQANPSVLGGPLLDAYSQLLQAHHKLLQDTTGTNRASSAYPRSAQQSTRSSANNRRPSSSVHHELQAHVDNQETTLPQAFSTLTLEDFGNVGWNMDTGHPGNDVLRSLVSSNSILCNKVKSPVLCHACQLGKHVRLPFVSSDSIVNSPFDIVHSDLWTSPLLSISGIQYYVLFLDHFSHYVWVYLLQQKSDTFSKFAQFRTFVKNQFKTDIKAFQCDHGGEFDNDILHRLFDKNGIHIRFSCPRTSQ